jgi:group II intron reverse transcriptase/maturase
MNRVNEDSLKSEHQRQSRRKASGVDGVTKDEYGANLDANISDLLKRMKAFQYKPLPVRRTYIPKINGNMRPLGIPSYEDKLVQGVMAGMLSDIYEERFCDCSYGYRPNRSQHDAIRYVDTVLGTKKVKYVVEADIKGFFDNVNHDWLMKFLENDIEDKNFLRYIKRFLIAGVMEGHERQESDKGTPQGGLISPVLANVYLHYVLDLWFEKVLKKECKGEVYYIRYADDFLFMFQYRNEAIEVMEQLTSRLNKFGLELAHDKTRMLPFGRLIGTKEDFDFLGFTFYNSKTIQGKYKVGIRTSKAKLKAKRAEAKAWLRTRLTMPVSETMKLIAASLRGHNNYYGVNGNTIKVHNYYLYVQYMYFRILNRRDQKGKLRYEKYKRIWDYYVEKPRVRVIIWTYQPKLT